MSGLRWPKIVKFCVVTFERLLNKLETRDSDRVKLIDCDLKTGEDRCWVVENRINSGEVGNERNQVSNFLFLDQIFEYTGERL